MLLQLYLEPVLAGKPEKAPGGGKKAPSTPQWGPRAPGVSKPLNVLIAIEEMQHAMAVLTLTRHFSHVEGTLGGINPPRVA